MSTSPAERAKLERAEHTLYGGILYGVEGRQIELQARFFGSPKPSLGWDINITGMAGRAVEEVQGRIRGAFAKYGLAPPYGHILVNLAPAGLPKFGTSLDLPVAIICLQAAGYIADLPKELERSHFFIGELSLHGEVRRINGALPIALAANPGSTLVVPASNEQECRLVRGMQGHDETRIAIAEPHVQEAASFISGSALG
jgi:magnesium chelatase family protein